MNKNIFLFSVVLVTSTFKVITAGGDQQRTWKSPRYYAASAGIYTMLAMSLIMPVITAEPHWTSCPCKEGNDCYSCPEYKCTNPGDQWWCGFNKCVCASQDK